VSEGRADELTAMEKYEGERLVVSGVVTSRGLKGFSRRETEFTGPYSAESREVTVRFPYVELEDNGSMLRCYFDEEERSAVASVSVGEAVTLAGDMRSFMGNRVIFDHCSLQ
jgi:hypothetical protein